MDVVWQTKNGEQTNFELEFIDKVLLSKVTHTNRFQDARCDIPFEGALVVYSCNTRHPQPELADYLARMEDHSLLHLSSEHLRHDSSCYANARAVLRSYYDPRIALGAVYAMPLGFKSGFLNAAPGEPDERDLVWSFAGQGRSHRLQMLDTLRPLQPNLVHLISGWSSADSMGVEQLRALYGRCVFMPCPPGAINPDTFRVMEALECGAIPVVIRFVGIDYFRYLYGDHPFIVADDWAHAASQMRALLDDRLALEERRGRVRDWYVRFKDDLASDVKTILESASDPRALVSGQFAYQRESRGDRRLKWAFSGHFGEGLMSRLHKLLPR